MRTPKLSTTGRRLAQATAVALVALAGTAMSAGGSHGSVGPVPADANGNLSNTITSDSPGSNCVTGSEAGCFAVVMRAAPTSVPLADPTVLTLAAATAALVTVMRRRRTDAAAE
jgi:hypothetical protein